MSTPNRPSAGGLATALSLTTASQIAATSSVLGLSAVTVSAASSLGVSPHFIGYQVSLIYAAGIMFSMMAGGMVKRWGAGRVGQSALILAGCGFLSIASGYWIGIVAGSILIGVGYALNNPSSSHILRKLAPEARRNLVFSAKQAGVPLGGVWAALMLPPLALTLGWQWGLIIFALLPFSLALVYLRFIPGWDQDRQPNAKIIGNIISGQKQVWRDPTLRCLSLLGLLFSAVQLSISAFIITILMTELHWHAPAAALAAAVMQAGGAFGRILWGMVADWLGSGFVVLAFVGAITGVATLTLGVMAEHPSYSLVILFVTGVTGLGWNGVVLAETARYSPKGGTLTGEVLTWTFVGVVIGPALFSLTFGILQDYDTTLGLFSLFCFAGAALSLHQYWVKRRSKTIAAE